MKNLNEHACLANAIAEGVALLAQLTLANMPAMWLTAFASMDA